MGPSIHEACRLGDLASVRMLVTQDPAAVDADDARQWRPVFYAAVARHLGVVRFLIQAGADLGAHGGAALRYAAEVPSNRGIVELLITHGVLDAMVRPSGVLDRQFLGAVFLGDEFRVRAMQRLHAGLASRPDGRGDHPLHHAAGQGRTAIVRALIAGGADVNGCNAHGQTVLYCAGARGHVDTVRLLLARGADPAAQPSRDVDTLHTWLGQYPNNPDLMAVRKLLDEQAGMDRSPSGIL